MKKVLVIFIVLLVFIVALFVFGSRISRAPDEISKEETLESSVSPSSTVLTNQKSDASFLQVYEITITAGGLSAQNLTLKAGETVKFTNFDEAPHWPASDGHPAHNQCPGFDALRGLTKGESYVYTFSQAQTCSFHDHINANRQEYKGAVVVTER